jgi:hypothetical protein
VDVPTEPTHLTVLLQFSSDHRYHVRARRAAAPHVPSTYIKIKGNSVTLAMPRFPFAL